MKTLVKDILKYGAPTYAILSVVATVLPGLHLPASVGGEVSAIIGLIGAVIAWAQAQPVAQKAKERAMAMFKKVNS